MTKVFRKVTLRFYELTLLKSGRITEAVNESEAKQAYAWLSETSDRFGFA